MDVLLVPGFWLDATSWDAQVPALRAAGHTVHAVTLPGMDAIGADRSAVTLDDQVDAVTALVDGIDGPVVLVGHSGGGSVIGAVVDRRPHRIARAIYVDSGPLPEGASINDRLPVVDGEVPLPDWSAFGEAELRDLDDELRARFRARAIPTPVHVAQDAAHPTDERRFDVPSTSITTSMSEAELRAVMDPEHEWAEFFSELAGIRDLEIVELPTGHWPQFTKPAELADALVAAIR